MPIISTLPHNESGDDVVPAAEVVNLFRDFVAGIREECSVWFATKGHRRAIVLLAEHPFQHLFWLVAPDGEGRFLLISPWTDEGEALIDFYDLDWPERIRWQIHARLPFTLGE